MSLAKFAAIGSVSKTTQLAYESGTHVPTLSYLVDVAELGVDATYILSGKHGHSYGGDVLNWELMEQLIKVLEDCESERARPLSVSVKVNALRLLYSQFSSSGVIDYKLVKAALAMAA
jgi:transcriptional regulator with XRE-family HTH domain